MKSRCPKICPQPQRQLLKALFAAGLLLAIAPPLPAQELQVEATPFSTLLDFSLLRNPAAAPPNSLPIWLDSVQILKEEPATLSLVGLPELKPKLAPESPEPPDQPLSLSSSNHGTSHTTYRIRLRRMSGFNENLLLRLYFEDTPEQSPIVTGWSETGTQHYISPHLGSGLDLPTTATLRIPTEGIDYLDISVAGDGSTIRQAFIATLHTTSAHAALDFSPPGQAPLIDPFGAPDTTSDTPFTTASEETTAPVDSLLYGRIHAPLDSGEIRITPHGTSRPTRYNVEFTLERAPLLAMISFEILNADPISPPTGFMNETNVGPIAITLPDLSDPAYNGISRPFESLGFRYTSWARCQKAIPGRLLQAGQNRFTLELPPGSDPLAIRHLSIQLKHHWQKLDYTLSPL